MNLQKKEEEVKCCKVTNMPSAKNNLDETKRTTERMNERKKKLHQNRYQAQKYERKIEKHEMGVGVNVLCCVYASPNIRTLCSCMDCILICFLCVLLCGRGAMWLEWQRTRDMTMRDTKQYWFCSF